MPYRRRRKPRPIVNQAMELALSVPQVLIHRLTRLSLAGHSPSLRDRKEFCLMGAEKIEAFYESWTAMLVEIFQANLRLAFSPVFLWSPWPGSPRVRRRLSAHARQTAFAVLGSGLAPVHRRAVANARRLRRVRVR